MRRSFGRVALGVTLVVSGCAADLKRANLRELQMRAAFDLACPPASLGLYPFDERSKGVTGCGRRLSYVEVCDHTVGSCTWMIDGALAAAAAVEKPLTPALASVPLPLPTANSAALVPAPPPLELKPLDLEDRK